MNKTLLTEAIASRTGMSKRESAAALDAMLDEIVHQVANGNKVVIAGFGTFEPTVRAARNARNPQTGNTVQVPEKTTPKFKAGATFKGAVNK